MLLTAALGATHAGADTTVPDQLTDVAFEQRIGESLPLDTRLTDETGREVALGDYFGERPVILALAYYECPMLCTLVLDGLTRTLRAVQLDPGADFEVVVLSFDARESAELAAGKKRAYMQRYARPGTEDGWHFLTGNPDAIAAVTSSAGFRYVYDEEDDTFAHASGIIVATPDGTLARYFYGIEYAPRDVRLGLVEAGDGRLGGIVDQLLLYCFHYDPETGTYSALAMSSVRIAGGVTVLGIGALLGLLWRRERRAAKAGNR